MVICLERGADLFEAQLMPLPLTVSCFSKIEISFTFLVLAHPDKGPLNGCVFALLFKRAYFVHVCRPFCSPSDSVTVSVRGKTQLLTCPLSLLIVFSAFSLSLRLSVDHLACMICCKHFKWQVAGPVSLENGVTRVW